MAAVGCSGGVVSQGDAADEEKDDATGPPCLVPSVVMMPGRAGCVKTWWLGEGGETAVRGKKHKDMVKIWCSAREGEGSSAQQEPADI